MHRRYRLPVLLLLMVAALLTACGGGSKGTDTPPPPTPTTAAAPTTAPTAAAGSAASPATTATRPASSAVSSGVAATTAPTTAAGSVASGTRPASSVVTSSTSAAGPAPTVTGTRPAGSATTGSVTAGGTTAAGSSAAGTGMTLFTDPKGRFSVSRPAAWTVGQSTSADSIVQFNSTDPLGVVDISTESVPASATPSTYRDAAVAEISKSIPDAQQVGTLSLQLGSEPAIQIDYTGTVSGNKIYFSQIFALHKGTAYILTLGTQPADIEKMKQQAFVLVQTWKFLQ
jgi:hypothetical protein